MLGAAICLPLLAGCASQHSVKVIPDSIANAEWASELRSFLKTGDAGGVSGEARQIEANLGVR